jgi:hypothetical protein
MTKAATFAQRVIRVLGFTQVVIGIAIWMGYGLRPPVVHIGIGFAFVLGLWVLAILGARARAGGGLVALLVAWGVLTAALGIVQGDVLPGPHHWVIRVLHLVVGLAAVGQAEALAGRMRRASAP